MRTLRRAGHPACVGKVVANCRLRVLPQVAIAASRHVSKDGFKWHSQAAPIAVQVWTGYIFLLLAVVLVIIDYKPRRRLRRPPDLIRDLNLTVEDVGAAINGYLAVAAAFMIPVGKLADRMGRRQLLLAGLADYAAGSVLTGLAWSFWPLLAGRILLGLSLATVLPSGLGLLNSLFPPQRPGRHRALGLWATAIGIRGRPRPPYRRNIGRHILMALGIFGRCAAGRTRCRGRPAGITGERKAPGGKLRHHGNCFARACRGSLVVVADRGDLVGATTSAILRAATAGWLRCFVGVERARARAGREVIASLALFRHRSFRVGTVAAALISCGDIGFQLVLPLFTGFVFGYDPLAVGLVLAAYGLGIGFGGALAERACRRFDERSVAVAAISVLPLSLLALMPMFTPGGSGVAMAGVLAVYGIAWGTAYATLVNVIFRDVPEPASAMAGGMQSSMRLLAGALAAAALTAIFTGVSMSRIDPAATMSQRASPEHIINASPKVLYVYHRLDIDQKKQTITPSDEQPVAAAVGNAYAAGAQATIAVAAGLTLLALGAGLALPRGAPPLKKG